MGSHNNRCLCTYRDLHAYFHWVKWLGFDGLGLMAWVREIRTLLCSHSILAVRYYIKMNCTRTFALEKVKIYNKNVYMSRARWGSNIVIIVTSTRDRVI